MTIVGLMTQECPRYYYNEDKTALRMDKIAFDISNNANRFSPDLIHLLKRCLHPNPIHRLTFQEAGEQIDLLRSNSCHPVYCLRALTEEKDEPSKTVPLKTNFLVNTIEKKLNFPVKRVSKTEKKKGIRK